MTTRRNVLRTAIVAAVAAPVSAAAICTAPGAPAAVSTASPAVRQLWERWSAAKANAAEADAILSDAVAFARAAWPVSPEEIRYRASSLHYPRPECRVSRGFGIEGGELQSYGVDEPARFAIEPGYRLSRADKRERAEQLERATGYEAACEAVRDRFNIHALAATATNTAAAEKFALAALMGATVRSLSDVAMKADAAKSSGVGPLMLNAERLAADVLAIADA